ncbi:hypothetical protein FOPG_18908 [Fusarium oxysporum f. sp. conglutinans race 2 54008]|uniref:Uncharacterized protein n=1 Tax=Fusarium oxysporum f. sp. conglutinans race 2 54008 TaxID=1089457 RepID=X0HUM7_FUSOX|nr:hypothetical protein FOPG_18908 [Fusarium oxysporum f. sp. conglutinans race 2 54008]
MAKYLEPQEWHPANEEPSRIFRRTTLLHPSLYTPHPSLCPI